jgi:hypothetical protein
MEYTVAASLSKCYIDLIAYHIKSLQLAVTSKSREERNYWIHTSLIVMQSPNSILGLLEGQLYQAIKSKTKDTPQAILTSFSQSIHEAVYQHSSTVIERPHDYDEEYRDFLSWHEIEIYEIYRHLRLEPSILNHQAFLAFLAKEYLFTDDKTIKLSLVYLRKAINIRLIKVITDIHFYLVLYPQHNIKTKYIPKEEKGVLQRKGFNYLQFPTDPLKLKRIYNGLLARKFITVEWKVFSDIFDDKPILSKIDWKFTISTLWYFISEMHKKHFLEDVKQNKWKVTSDAFTIKGKVESYHKFRSQKKTHDCLLIDEIFEIY